MSSDFRVIKEKKSNKKESVIERFNMTHRFTLTELESDLMQLEKFEKELEGKRMIEDAKMQNVATHHPIVKRVSELDRYAIHVYQESAAMVKAINPKLKEVRSQIAEYKKEKAQIIKMLGIEEVKEEVKNEKSS